MVATGGEPFIELQVMSHDGIPLAVRDHGGEGPSLLLMHGAGTHLLALEVLARSLRRYRVVTMDQRWSGQSGDSDTYSWDDLVSDVESVVHALSLGNPAVGGHSWGGMIAVRYAIRHPAVPAVINLDGNGPGDVSLYDGVDPAAFDALTRQMADPPPHLGAEGGSAWKDLALVEMARAHQALGMAEVDSVAHAERSFLRLPGGRWRLHPSRPMYQGLTGDQKMFDLYRSINAPLLVVLSGGTDWGPPSARSLMAAYRRGLQSAFAELTAERSNVTLVELPETTHVSLVGHHASTTAGVIEKFLDEAGHS